MIELPLRGGGSSNPLYGVNQPGSIPPEISEYQVAL